MTLLLYIRIAIPVAPPLLYIPSLGYFLTRDCGRPKAVEEEVEELQLRDIYMWLLSLIFVNLLTMLF